MNILIIDDDRGYALGLMARCANVAVGCKVRWAKNGKEAIDMIDDVRPNLIICDKEMPIMDGLETIRLIRSMSEYANIPILMNSACDDDCTPLNAIDAGATIFIKKPIKLNQIRKIAISAMKMEAA